MQLPRDMVEERIRELAEDSSTVYVTHHASDRMAQRGINQMEVIRCLKAGVVTEGPILDSHKQRGWKVTMELFCAGRSVGVAAKLVEQGNDYIIVITAFTS